MEDVEKRASSEKSWLRIFFSFLRGPLQKPIAGKSNILPEGAPQCPFAAQNRIPDTLHGFFFAWLVNSTDLMKKMKWILVVILKNER